MMAILIAAVSLAALVEVYLSYCRSVLASARRVELSSRAVGLAGMEGKSLMAKDFERILQLLYLCPEHDADRTGVRAIGAYYRLLQVLSSVFGRLNPRLVLWTEHESARCSHFAAVVLDRSISSSRSFLNQQASDQL